VIDGDISETPTLALGERRRTASKALICGNTRRECHPRKGYRVLTDLTLTWSPGSVTSA